MIFFEKLAILNYPTNMALQLNVQRYLYSGQVSKLLLINFLVYKPGFISYIWKYVKIKEAPKLSLDLWS